MIPTMPTVGGTELLIILAIILLFFGASRVPQLGRSLGQGLQEFRKGAAKDSEEKGKPRELNEERGELPREEEVRPSEARDQTGRVDTRDEFELRTGPKT